MNGFKVKVSVSLPMVGSYDRPMEGGNMHASAYCAERGHPLENFQAVRGALRGSEAAERPSGKSRLYRSRDEDLPAGACEEGEGREADGASVQGRQAEEADTGAAGRGSTRAEAGCAASASCTAEAGDEARAARHEAAGSAESSGRPEAAGRGETAKAAKAAGA